VKHNIILPVLAVLAIAAPTAVYFSANAYSGYRAAAVRNVDMKWQQKALREYSVQVAEYNRFAARVERFISSARKAGVAEESWDRHHVDIKQRVVKFSDMDRFIADAAGGDKYYFLPERLLIEVPRDAPGARIRGREKLGHDEVKVSLKGEFLVRIK